jgi:hypothetical protein
VPPETREAFLIESEERRANRLRVAFFCVAKEPRTFRAWLYLVLGSRGAPSPELLS